MPKYEPVNPTSRYQKTQWMNTLVHVHDLQCSCDEPLEHTVHVIATQEPNLKFNKESLKPIKKWLTDTEDGTPEEEEPFGNGELEALFAQEDGGDENTTAIEDTKG